MSYRITRDADSRPRIVLHSEPPYCRALEAAPAAREPELATGTWLVLAFAAWSVPDTAAIEVALDVARRFGGQLTLGVRPFDDPAELEAWCPGLERDAAGPVWVLLDDGEMRMRHQGFLSVDALVDAIEVAGQK